MEDLKGELSTFKKTLKTKPLRLRFRLLASARVEQSGVMTFSRQPLCVQYARVNNRASTEPNQDNFLKDKLGVKIPSPSHRIFWRG